MYNSSIINNLHNNDADISHKVIPFISLLSIIGHPCFYIICKYMGYYENLGLRIAAATLFIPLLFKRKKIGNRFVAYSEFTYVFSLPFLFSFLLYANNQNLYWTISMLFAGASYGILARKLSSSFVVLPLSCILSFIIYNILIHQTPLSYFYHSIIPTLSAIGCSCGMFFVKSQIKSILLLSIEITANQQKLNDNIKLKELAEKNLALQREIYSGQRLRLIANLSIGVFKEIENSFRRIQYETEALETPRSNTEKKQKISTVLKITRQALIALKHVSSTASSQKTKSVS